MYRALFCDWDSKPENFEYTSLFELPDLSPYQLIFFDPLEFALKNGLRKNKNELWIAEYTSVDEDELIEYLTQVRYAVEKIKDFISAGGIWIVRSDLPNSFIRVRKESVAASINNKYTESVIAAFFWFNEFLGKYSFQYGFDSSLYFPNRKNHIYRVFKDVPVRWVQTQNHIPGEGTEVIADNGPYSHLPVISRLAVPWGAGQIYLIPKFLDKKENQKLLEAFSQIYKDSKYGPYSPYWAGRYEKTIAKVNPYTPLLEDLEREEKRLQKLKLEYHERFREYQEFTELLYATEEDFLLTLKQTFSLFGFHVTEASDDLKKNGIGLILRDYGHPKILVRICASADTPIMFDCYYETKEKIRKCFGENPPKTIMVANAYYKESPVKRKQWFDDTIMQENWHTKYCLLTTWKLFELTCFVLENSHAQNINLIKKQIRKDLLACDALFDPTPRKYLSVTTLTRPVIEETL